MSHVDILVDSFKRTYSISVDWYISDNLTSKSIRFEKKAPIDDDVLKKIPAMTLKRIKAKLIQKGIEPNEDAIKKHISPNEDFFHIGGGRISWEDQITPSKEFIDHLCGSQVLSIFSAILLISYARNGNAGVLNVIGPAPRIGASGVDEGLINPRHPGTGLCPVDSQNDPRYKYPDLTWTLTKEEIDSWAMSCFGVDLEKWRYEQSKPDIPGTKPAQNEVIGNTFKTIFTAIERYHDECPEAGSEKVSKEAIMQWLYSTKKEACICRNVRHAYTVADILIEHFNLTTKAKNIKK